MTLGTREMLLQQRNKCLNRLRDLGPLAADLVAEVEGIDMALANFSSRGTQRYAGERRAIDAIVASLTIHERAMTADELANDIVTGGWRGGNRLGRYSVKESVHYHTCRPRGIVLNILRSMPPGDATGMIGLYEWPDEKFARLKSEQADITSG